MQHCAWKQWSAALGPQRGQSCLRSSSPASPQTSSTTQSPAVCRSESSLIGEKANVNIHSYYLLQTSYLLCITINTKTVIFEWRSGLLFKYCYCILHIYRSHFSALFFFLMLWYRLNEYAAPTLTCFLFNFFNLIIYCSICAHILTNPITRINASIETSHFFISLFKVQLYFILVRVRITSSFDWKYLLFCCHKAQLDFVPTSPSKYAMMPCTNADMQSLVCDSTIIPSASRCESQGMYT